MQKLIAKLRRIKLVFRRSRPLIKVVALCAVVFSTLALLTITSAILDSRARSDALYSQAAALEQANEELAQSIDGLDSVQGIRSIAENELGLVDPGTVIIDVKPQQ